MGILRRHLRAALREYLDRTSDSTDPPLADQMLGNLIYTNVGAANNLPMAAALALVPIAIMFVYLGAVKRTGALDSL